MKVLVPLDGSPLADRILGPTRRLCEGETSEVKLLRVIDFEYGSSVQQAEAIEEADKHLSGRRQDLAEPPDLEVRILSLVGDPAAEIIRIADEDEVDLVAMATHGRTGIKRWVRGSVAERVLRNGRRPLFLANPHALGEEAIRPRIDSILVPLDRSPASAIVLPLVGVFAQRLGAEVILLNVDSPEGGTVHPVPEVARRQAQKRAETGLEETRLQLLQAGLEKVRVLGRYGDPAVEILDLAGEVDAGLIAMATHGRSGFSRWRFGSVAEHVLRHCSRPLLVARVTGEES